VKKGKEKGGRIRRGTVSNRQLLLFDGALAILGSGFL